MKSFPLIKTKWTNEHIMAAAFLVLILYHLPRWSENPWEIASFVILVAEGLLIDAVINLLRYHRMWCCVSGAVTAAMLSLLTAGVPLWIRLVGVAAALLAGKQIWGGTGKNAINPAMTGLLLLLLFFPIPHPFFPESYLLIPAVIFSLPFLLIRPFAGIGFILGMVAALFVNGDLSLMNLLSEGVFFWGCLVLTDPVTVTDHPAAGSAAGFLAGFAALFYYPLPIAIIIGILAVNLFSAAIENLSGKSPKLLRSALKLPKAVRNQPDQTAVIDLTGEKNLSEEENNETGGITRDKAADTEQLSQTMILQRINDNNVFGMGGAAFPTYQKLITVMAAKGKKHLIINGVECDPGLIHDAWLLRNKSEQIIKGIEILSKCTGFETFHLAVKDTKEINYPEHIKIHKIRNFYPAGAERILISKVLDKKFEYDEIPAVNGILVLNVQTVYAIYEAVSLNKKINTRYLTVANLQEKDAKVVKVKLGRKIHEVMDAVYPGKVNVFAGGGVMQSYFADEDAVVDRYVNFIAASSFPKYKESPQCSKCGNCSRHCPAGLKVNLIADLVDQGNAGETDKFLAKECISCGSCSYSCLAGRNLAAKVKEAKEALR